MKSWIVSWSVIFLYYIQGLWTKQSPQVLCRLVNGAHECYPKLFIPSHQWKDVLPDQQIPPGLHVRLNMATGRRQAKLLENESEDKHVGLVLVSTEPVVEEPRLKKKPRAPGQQVVIDNQSKPMVSGKKSLSLEEKDALRLILDQLNQNNGSHTGLLSDLEYLSEIVHDVFIGQELINYKAGMTQVLGFLHHDSPQVRAEAALVIGNAVSNNPTSGSNPIHSKTLLSVMSALEVESQERVLNRCMFALGTLVRSQGPLEFYRQNGMELLKRLYAKETSLRPKIFNLVRDLLDPDMFPKDEFVRGQDLLDKGWWLQSDVSFWCAFSKEQEELEPFLKAQFECLD